MIPALQTQICSRVLALHVVTFRWDEPCAILRDELCLRVLGKCCLLLLQIYAY